MAKKNTNKKYILLYEGAAWSGPWTHKELIEELATGWDHEDRVDLEVYELGKKMKLTFQEVRVE